MERILRHTDVTVSAGLQPSYKTFRQTVVAEHVESRGRNNIPGGYRLVNRERGTQ